MHVPLLQAKSEHVWVIVPLVAHVIAEVHAPYAPHVVAPQLVPSVVRVHGCETGIVCDVQVFDTHA